MKILKFTAVFVFLVFSLSLTATATNVYEQNYQQSGLEEIFSTLPKEVKEFLGKNDIDMQNSDWTKKLTEKGVIASILDFLRSGAKKPLTALCEIIGVLIIAGAASDFCDSKSQIYPALNYIFSVIIAIVLIYNTFSLVTNAVAAIKGIGTFMLSFIPIFSGIVLLGGKATTSVAANALLLTAAEAIMQVTSLVILPFMSAYLAVGISSSVSPLLKNTSLSETLKKVVLWALGLLFTLFLGLLSIQTSVSAAADTLSVKTARFMVGSFVPVAGSALGEALGVVTTAASALKSSAGMYAVVCLAIIVLPILAEILLWRAAMAASKMAANIFAIPKAPQIIDAVDSVLAVITGIIFFVAALFIISLAVVVKAGG